MRYNVEGQLPVQEKTVWDYFCTPYIPFLAFEGVKHNVGGTDKRGRLLVEDRSSKNKNSVLHLLACVFSKSKDVPRDAICLNVLKGLKESNLFLKQDIQDYNLLTLSCRTTCQLRFDYLAEMDPEGLKQH